jgi:hypothetical protein
MQVRLHALILRLAKRQKRQHAAYVFFSAWARACTRAVAMEGTLRAVCRGARSDRVKNALMPLAYTLRYRSAPAAFNAVAATCFLLFGRPPARAVRMDPHDMSCCLFAWFFVFVLLGRMRAPALMSAAWHVMGAIVATFTNQWPCRVLLEKCLWCSASLMQLIRLS